MSKQNDHNVLFDKNRLFDSSNSEGVRPICQYSEERMGAALTTPVKPSSAPITFKSQGSTQFTGGLPGYTVLDNVWYRNGTLYMIENGNDDLPNQDKLLTLAPVGGDGIHTLTTVKIESHGPEGEITELDGTTIFCNDGWPGSWSGYFMYYHFASEVILGSYSVLSSVSNKPLPSEMKKPWNVYKGLGRRLDLHEQHYGNDQISLGSSNDIVNKGSKADRILVAWEWNWDGKDGLTRAVSQGLVGEKGLLDPPKWKEITNDNRWIYFERLLLTDRDTAHHNNRLSQKWYKMALDTYKLVESPDQLQNFRETFLNHYKIPIVNRPKPGQSIDGKKLKIIYTDRQGSQRKFPEEVHEELLTQMQNIEQSGKAHIIDAKLENIKLEDQFALFADADIIFGVHGNGLTHELWMPPGGVVIEIFPPQTFAYDYPPISAVLGHEHIIWRENQTFPSDLWEPENGGEGNRLHDGSPFPLNVPVFSEWLQKKIDEML
ncbi:uncharacterized protein L201_002814 [Kwoniella dendrophila CBS 6074]|uniref:Glycosyltransferase 61 catalytic domain-containing protein n=1 Tax=Kwoniella dendrophila CBS 6074 TaxID=1295534 RepID=A0AAX4JRF2_9TREE